MDVPSLADTLPDLAQHAPNPRKYPVRGCGECGAGLAFAHLMPPTRCPQNFIKEDNIIIADIVRKASHEPVSRAYVRAGPRRALFFEPTAVTAAIVTCGGLCPGLNNIIREVTRTLLLDYGASRVLGITDGFNGFDAAAHPPTELTLASVERIHDAGGTVLGSARGGFNLAAIEAFVDKYSVQCLFIVGGDGTHRGAVKIARWAADAGRPLAVVGIPKTIDNDVSLVDRSFGFTTAVGEAVKAIKAAVVEARSAPHCVGLVKLMGRHAGFIAAHATLASGDVDACLVPEVTTPLHGQDGLIPHLHAVIQRKGHAVVVVAEGAGTEYMPPEVDEQGKPAVDAGGNAKLPPVGPWLRDTLARELGALLGEKPPVKLIDPSYVIRSVPANASDALYCLLLGQNAVHGAMAGLTGFSVGLYNNRTVYIPMQVLVDNSPRVMDPLGRTWERVLGVTGQPFTAQALKAKKGAPSYTMTPKTFL